MNHVVNGERAVTPATALRIAKFTSTEPEFWLNLQQAVDLWDARDSDQATDLDKIQQAQID